MEGKILVILVLAAYSNAMTMDPAGGTTGQQGGTVPPQSGTPQQGGTPPQGGTTQQGGTQNAGTQTGSLSPYEAYLQQLWQQEQQQQYYYQQQQQQQRLQQQQQQQQQQQWQQQQRPQQQQRQQYSPLDYLLYQSNDNQFFRYMLLSGGLRQMNPLWYLWNN